MNRIRKDNKGVSPVIATILMVAITVVLAGVLVVYLQTLPSSGGNVETTLGLRCEKVTDGWLISITNGEKLASSVTLLETSPATGVTVYTHTVSVADANNFVWNNPGANTKLDAGDSILLRSTSATPAGSSVAGDKVQFLLGGTVIGTIKELPA